MFSLITCLEDFPYQIAVEAALLQKTRLSGLLPESHGKFAAKPLLPRPRRMTRPLLRKSIQIILNQIIVDSAFPEFLGNPEGSVSFLNTVKHVTFGKPVIALQTFRMQRGNQGSNRCFIITTQSQFTGKFQSAVLASRQQSERGLAYVCSFSAQASVSSLGSIRFISGSNLARIARSKSTAMAGFCFRKSRALSLP